MPLNKNQNKTIFLVDNVFIEVFISVHIQVIHHVQLCFHNCIPKSCLLFIFYQKRFSTKKERLQF